LFTKEWKKIEQTMKPKPITQEPSKSLSPPKVILVGNPNVGKSVIFNYLTGTYRVVSNYPGTTVEVSSGTAKSGDFSYTVLDTPGVNNLIPNSEDEKVTRDILLSETGYRVINVLDAKNLRRGLLIALQLIEMGLPMVLVLNMMDEAKSRGIEINLKAMKEIFGLPVVSTVATQKKGLEQLVPALKGSPKSAFSFQYSEPVEAGIACLLPLLPSAPISGRSLALMLLAGDVSFRAWLEERLTPQELARIETHCSQYRRNFQDPLSYRINLERLEKIDQLLLRLQTKGGNSVQSWGRRLGEWSTHRVVGFLWMLAVLFLSYEIIGVLGADIAVGFMEKTVFGGYINPFLTRLVRWVIPIPLVQDLLVGPYGIFTMALTYALALILPIVGFFFLIFGFLEDSGYLPRLAVMSNRVFKIMGLNGKAVLPMILGLGCDTMATMTTRILESRKDKIIVTLLLALGIPCSAQLAVIFGMLAGFPAWIFIAWALIIFGVILLVGFLAGKLIPGEGAGFILELPPLRWPQMKNILIKTLSRIEWYLQEAVPLFILGTLILFALDKSGVMTSLEYWARPLVVNWLGLPVESTSSFIIGFLRRDYGAAGFFALAQKGLLNHNQVLVALVTITLFVPCIANFFVIIKERGWKTALAIVGVVVFIALFMGGLVNWALKAWA
jgi:ferrous iron transport protein B